MIFWHWYSQGWMRRTWKISRAGLSFLDFNFISLSVASPLCNGFFQDAWRFFLFPIKDNIDRVLRKRTPVDWFSKPGGGICEMGVT